MARNRREATAADVRAWAIENNWKDANGNGVGERGRFSSDLITDFNNAMRRRNIEYVGGTPQAQVTQTRQRSTAVATRPQSRTGDSAPPRRAPRATARSTAPAREVPTPRPVESAPSATRVVRDEDEAMEMFRDVIAQLSAASNVQGREGEPVLMHVEGWTLSYAS